jgi:hypothetical protein
MTLDFWESFGAYDAFLNSHKLEYEALEKIGDGLTQRETRVGWFDGLTAGPAT